MEPLDPQLVESFTLELGQAIETVMALSMAVMMFAVALGLRAEHFGFFKSAPQVFVAGLFGQLLALPLLTLALCFLLAPLPSIALGMILIACCPGGNVSNLLVLLARGNPALSVSLTATSSVLAAFLTPMAILVWSGLYPPTAQLLTRIDFDAARFLFHTALILALPLLSGMWLARNLTDVAHRLRKPLILLASLCLVGIIVAGTYKYLDEFLVIGVRFLGLVALHNAAAFAIGYLIARLAKAKSAERRAITFEVGIQNAGLGIVILLTQLGGLGGAAAVVGLWGTWHIVAGLVLVGLFRISDRLW